MGYIPVYSVYAIYRRDKSVCWPVCIWQESITRSVYLTHDSVLGL